MSLEVIWILAGFSDNWQRHEPVFIFQTLPLLEKDQEGKGRDGARQSVLTVLISSANWSFYSLSFLYYW